MRRPPRTVPDLPQYTAARRLRRHCSPAEAALWRHLQRRQLGGLRFRRQHAVGPFLLDFYCPAARLAIELDGAVHDDPARRAYDAGRARALEALGIRVVRFENRRVFEDPAGVCAVIAAACAGAASGGG